MLGSGSSLLMPYRFFCSTGVITVRQRSEFLCNAEPWAWHPIHAPAHSILSSRLPSTSLVLAVTCPGSAAVSISTLADEETEAEKGESLACSHSVPWVDLGFAAGSDSSPLTSLFAGMPS